MFKKIFAKPKPEAHLNALSTIEKLTQTLEMLEKKEQVFEKKAANELESAKGYAKVKNKRAAIQSLKRKKLYELQIESLGNFQLRIHDQMIMLEAAKATTDTVQALKTGADAISAIQKETNIDDVEKAVEEINEQTQKMKEIQDALSNPIGFMADFDEDDILAELDMLDESLIEEDLLEPVIANNNHFNSPHITLSPLRSSKPQATKSDDAELDDLLMEMAS